MWSDIMHGRLKNIVSEFWFKLLVWILQNCLFCLPLPNEMYIQANQYSPLSGGICFVLCCSVLYKKQLVLCCVWMLVHQAHSSVLCCVYVRCACWFCNGANTIIKERIFHCNMIIIQIDISLFLKNYLVFCWCDD